MMPPTCTFSSTLCTLKFLCICAIGFGYFIVSSESLCLPAVRLASWNILAQEYIEDSSSSSNSPSKYYLEWKYRRKLISKHLKHIDADIICLQEVQVDTWPEFYLQTFASQYEGHLQDVGNGHNVATATLIRKELSLLGRRYKVDRIESRSRALLVVLKETGSNGNPSNNLYIWNVHLEAGKQQLNDYHRFCQLKSLFRRLRYHCSLDGTTIENSNIVIAGDFNMLRRHPNYRGLTEGQLENPEQKQKQRSSNNKKKTKKTNKSQIIQTIPLIDSYGSYHNNYFPGVNTAHTTAGSRQHYLASSCDNQHSNNKNDDDDDVAGTNTIQYPKRQKLVKTYSGGFVLDYIWHSKRINIKDSLLFHPSSTSSLTERWPSIDHPSDHIPIGIELEW